MSIRTGLAATARAAALALALLTPAAPAAEWVVTVKGTGADLGETPVVAALPAPVPAGSYAMKPEGSGATLAAQVFEDDGTSYLGFVLDRLSGDTVVRYTLAPADPEPARSVSIEPEGPNLAIAVGGEPLTTYVTDGGPKPFYYPVIGPTGTPITRAYPMAQVEGEPSDHPHQRSFWFTHGAVNGVDFWSEAEGHGSIRETGRPTVAAGPAVGRVRTRDAWLGPDGNTVLDDERVLTVYATRSGRVIDFDVTLKATAGPVTFGDTKEGMFGLRVASSMDVARKKGGRITNAEGLHDEAAWGKPSPWVDYAGPVEGATVGVAILNHPESFRYPTTWHVRTYGLFAANPFGWKDFGLGKSGEFRLPEGESIRFRYRVILHEGATDSADIPAAFRSYARPPAVEVGEGK